MTYRLRVETANLRSTMTFWDRFMTECGFLEQESNHDIDYYLEPYRAKNVVGEPYIDFDTESDALMFILRWS